MTPILMLACKQEYTHIASLETNEWLVFSKDSVLSSIIGFQVCWDARLQALPKAVGFLAGRCSTRRCRFSPLLQDLLCYRQHGGASNPESKRVAKLFRSAVGLLSAPWQAKAVAKAGLASCLADRQKRGQGAALQQQKRINTRKSRAGAEGVLPAERLVTFDLQMLLTSAQQP